MLQRYVAERETIDLSSVAVKMMNVLSYRNEEDHMDKLLQCSFLPAWRGFPALLLVFI